MNDRRGMLLVIAGGLAALAVAMCWRVADGRRQGPPEPDVKAEAPAHPDSARPQTEKTRVSTFVEAFTGSSAAQKTTGGLQEQSDRVAEFRHLQDCLSAYRQALTLRNQQDVCKEADADRNPMCETSSRAAIDARLAEQFRNAAGCPEDISALEAEYYRKTVDLAAAGDVDAQLCFAQSRFQIGRSWSEEEVSFYKANAPVYLQNALERGDWRAVQLLATSPRVLAHSRSLLGFIAPKSQLEQYKLNRLLRLGAVDGYAEQLDAVANDSELPIDAGERKKAEAWAQNEYQKYFRNSPTLNEAPQPCAVRG